MTGKHQATIAVRSGIDTDPVYGAIAPPLYLTSTYTFAGFDEKRKFDYSRSGNPTRFQLGEALADLEQGAGAVVTACGMAAVTLVTSLVRSDELIIAPHDCYGGTYRQFEHQAKKGVYQIEFVDQSDDTALKAALAKKPKLVWIETPSNPLLRTVDIEKIAQLAHEVDALVVVDNTFLTPALQQPLLLGADIVVHSTTKYLNGHSDVLGGVAVAKTEALAEELNWWANCLGLTGGAFDAFLQLRGIRTLGLRMKQHQANAQAVIEFLSQQSKVKKIYHPSLPSDLGHHIAEKQQNGHVPMVSFELEGGVDTVKQFLSGLKLFALAESLGGVESLIAHPATMTHAAMDEAALATAGISQGLLRLSVGVEHIDDLIADLQSGLSQISA